VSQPDGIDLNPKSNAFSAPSDPDRGAFRERHERGLDAMDAAAAQDERRQSGRRSRVVLTPRRWRQVCGVMISQTMVAKKPGHQGERGGNR